jgi:DNA polymerase III subunit gamma/tau
VSADVPWSTIVAALDLPGPGKQLATNCTFIERNGAVVRLALDARSATAHTAAREEKLAQALSRYYGSEVRVQIEKQLGEVPTPAREREQAVQQYQSDAQASFAADPVVVSLQQQFSASIHPESVRPLKPI